MLARALRLGAAWLRQLLPFLLLPGWLASFWAGEITWLASVQLPAWWRQFALLPWNSDAFPFFMGVALAGSLAWRLWPPKKEMRLSFIGNVYAHRTSASLWLAAACLGLTLGGLASSLASWLQSSLKLGGSPWPLIAGAIGAPLALVVWAIRDRNKYVELQTERERNTIQERSERHTRYVDALERIQDNLPVETRKSSQPNLGARQGGLLTLEQLLKEDPKVYQGKVIANLCAYLLNNPLDLRSGLDKEGKARPEQRRQDDLREALRILGDVIENWEWEWFDIDLEGLSLPYLSANLRLPGIYLQDINLEGGKLWSANLQKAKLWHANLQGADLWHANLQGADLSRANLQGADLHDANLQQAKLGGINLQGVDLQDAQLQGAGFWDAKRLSFPPARVSKAQLLVARFDKTTTLPDGRKLTHAALQKELDASDRQWHWPEEIQKEHRYQVSGNNTFAPWED